MSRPTLVALGQYFKPFGIALLFIAACGTAASPQSSPPSAAARTPVTWLIFIDDLHLDFRNTGRLRDMLKTIVRELVQDGDQVAVASSGPSSLAVDATTDRERVALEIKKATGNALKYEDILQPYGSAEVLYRVSISVTRAQLFLTKASLAEPALKAMLYISNGSGFHAVPDPAQPAKVGRMRVPTRSEIAEQLAQLTATATQTGVRIFAIDHPRTTALDDPFAQPGDPGWEAHLFARQALLRSISGNTAGFAIIDGDFVAQLRRVADAIR